MPNPQVTLTQLNVAKNRLQDHGAMAIANSLRSELVCADAGPNRDRAGNQPYQSEKLMGMSTHICKHCGKHKDAHVHSGW